MEWEPGVRPINRGVATEEFQTGAVGHGPHVDHSRVSHSDLYCVVWGNINPSWVQGTNCVSHGERTTLWVMLTNPMWDQSYVGHIEYVIRWASS